MEMKNKLTGIRLETAEDGVTANLALRFVDAESAREFEGWPFQSQKTDPSE